jgi:hypothetical protein
MGDFGSLCLSICHRICLLGISRARVCVCVCVCVLRNMMMSGLNISEIGVRVSGFGQVGMGKT